jgi:hypothetical protein
VVSPGEVGSGSKGLFYNNTNKSLRGLLDHHVKINRSYQSFIDKNLSNWFEKPILNITIVNHNIEN